MQPAPAYSRPRCSRKSTRVTDPRGGIRSYAYSGDSGALEKLTEADGGILLFENTPEGLRNKKYDTLGYATTYSYRLDRAFTGTSDAGGNVTREEDALGRTVETDYDFTHYDQITHVKDKRGFHTYHDYFAASDAAPTRHPQWPAPGRVMEPTNLLAQRIERWRQSRHRCFPKQSARGPMRFRPGHIFAG